MVESCRLHTSSKRTFSDPKARPWKPLCHRTFPSTHEKLNAKKMLLLMSHCRMDIVVVANETCRLEKPERHICNITSLKSAYRYWAKSGLQLQKTEDKMWEVKKNNTITHGSEKRTICYSRIVRSTILFPFKKPPKETDSFTSYLFVLKMYIIYIHIYTYIHTSIGIIAWSKSSAIRRSARHLSSRPGIGCSIFYLSLHRSADETMRSNCWK